MKKIFHLPTFGFMIILLLAFLTTTIDCKAQGQLHIGAKIQPYWIDSKGGEIRTAAGGAVLASVAHYGEKLYSEGSAGWVNLVGNPNSFQAVELRAALGISSGHFTGTGEITRLWYFEGRNGGDTAIGLGGQFHLDLGRYRLLAGGRGGFFFSEYTTYYGSAFIGLTYRMTNKENPSR